MSIKDTIIGLEKLEMTLLLKEMKSDNLLTSLKNLEQHVLLLKHINEINYQSEGMKPSPLEPSQLEDKMELPVQKTSIPNNKKTIYKEEAASDHTWFRGQLIRQLKGGHVGAFQEAYVPERVIRDLEMEPFDWIQANLLDIRENKPRYEFMLLERNSAPLPSDYNRIEVTYAPVFKHHDLNRFYIKIKDQTTDRSEKSAAQVLLSEKDVLQFKITANSIIDYAYLHKNETFGRVTWKYAESQQPLILETKPPAKKVRKQSRVTQPKESARTVNPIFKQLTVTMVGGGNLNLQTSIKREIERREGSFIFCSGDEPKTTIKSRLKRSNAVVVFTESISHDAMNFTKAICKEFDIPVSYTKNLGSEQFIVRVNRLLAKEKLDSV